ncbi:hypothetical protein [Shewanella litorisediminis]|uniref:Uncharacterized protein n=1 Tax=Shewanella litorisediminis TaxID=1173586 RepID=A0ABX7FYI6_9GAMM|nr:hypothetical protein [Shewanella litorisediminis]QRH00116.1 hypothetical protein JQC75_09320 [Shewanella litorisediminis]
MSNPGTLNEKRRELLPVAAFFVKSGLKHGGCKRGEEQSNHSHSAHSHFQFSFHLLLLW